MAPHLAALLRQNISYTPIVWSAYGRPHPDTLTVLRSLSKSIARKRNIASAEVVFPQVALEHHTGDMETQRTANTHLLACDGPPRLSWTWTSSPRRGPFPSTWLSGLCFSRARSCVFFAHSGHGPFSWLWLSWHSGAPVRAALGGWPLRLSHRGMALFLSLSAAAVSPLLWCPLPCFLSAPCLAVMTCAGLQPSSPYLPSSRTPLRSASPGSWAALGTAAGSHAASAATTAPPGCVPPRPFGCCPSTRLQRPCRAQQPPRQPPPGPAPGLALLCRCRSVLRGAAPAPSLSRVVPSPSLSRDWSRAWPSRAAHQSLPLSCASPVSLARLLQLRALRGLLVKVLRLLHQRKPLRLPAFQMSRPTLTAIGMPSSTHTASPRLPNVAAAAVAQPADAAGAGRRARDKRRRRLRKAAKRSMWREI